MRNLVFNLCMHINVKRERKNLKEDILKMFLLEIKDVFLLDNIKLFIT